MANDLTRAVRRGLLALAKAYDPLTDLVPASRIYPQTTPALPTFPFIRSGAPSVIPVRATCLDGGEWTVPMHAFAKDRMASGAVVETAEDYAARIGAALAKALDRQSFDLDSGRARVLWTGSQLLMDPAESGAFHSVQQFRVRAITS